MAKLKVLDKRVVDVIRNIYGEKATNIRTDDEGRVFCWMNPMPNTNKPGEIFAGTLEEIYDEWVRMKEDQ